MRGTNRATGWNAGRGVDALRPDYTWLGTCLSIPIVGCLIICSIYGLIICSIASTVDENLIRLGDLFLSLCRADKIGIISYGHAHCSANPSLR